MTPQQHFFTDVLSHQHSPMDMLVMLDARFPAPASLPDLLDQLDELKKCLDSFRPLDTQQVARLQNVWDTEYTHQSNRIEGNTLTLAETSLVINDGLTVAGKTIAEHLEATNHKEAVQYLREIASGDVPFSETLIKNLHTLIMQRHSQYHDQRGRYRSVPVMITGTVYLPPQPWQVQKLMEDLLIHYAEKIDTLHPVALAADIHAELVGVHPFIDGNGRTSRLIMNFLLLRAGFPIANIEGDTANRLAYYQALNDSHIDHDDTPFRLLVAQYVRKSILSYLAMLASDISPENQDKGHYFFKKMQSL